MTEHCRLKATNNLSPAIFTPTVPVMLVTFRMSEHKCNAMKACRSQINHINLYLRRGPKVTRKCTAIFGSKRPIRDKTGLRVTVTSKENRLK